MKPFPHRYVVRAAAEPTGYADVRAGSHPVLRTAPPIEYNGPGDAWSPEHLLLAAVQTCFIFTLRAVARLSNVGFVSVEVETGGTVNRENGVTRFTEIVVRPTLIVPAGTDRGRAMNLLHKAEKACLVSASLATPIRLEPEVVEVEMPALAGAAG
jgi:peroxiredoxin-like protein